MKKLAFFFIFPLLLAAGLLTTHNVSKNITEEDKEYLELIFGATAKSADEMSFEEEIIYIDELLKQVHEQLPQIYPIDFEQSREPKNLLENKGGFCYDFSRSIEKQLDLSGFETRHVAVYKKDEGFFKTILARKVFSHSLSEVKTKNGWMIIDPLIVFYAQDVNGEIYSYEKLVEESQTPEWKFELAPGLKYFYQPEVVYVYGLYSRHGKFYPPYNFIPDFNVRELFYNF